MDRSDQLSQEEVWIAKYRASLDTPVQQTGIVRFRVALAKGRKKMSVYLQRFLNHWAKKPLAAFPRSIRLKPKSQSPASPERRARIELVRSSALEKSGTTRAEAKRPGRRRIRKPA